MAENKEEALFLTILLAIFVGIMVFLGYIEHQEQKVVYEITVVDKYETLGSSFHLVGGRATETEYHLIYESRLVDDNDGYARDNSCRGDRQVTPDMYRRTSVGSKFKQNSPKWY